MLKTKYAKYIATKEGYNIENNLVELKETNADVKLKGNEHISQDVSFDDNKYNSINIIFDSYEKIYDDVKNNYNNNKYDMRNFVNDMSNLPSKIDRNNNQIYSIEVDNEDDYYPDKFFHNDIDRPRDLSLVKTLNEYLNNKYDTSSEQYIK